jgi:ribosomal protein S18 acetylase RimI-like enzyme
VAATSIRLATAADVGKIASLVRRYWEFESIDGFDASRTETLLARLIGAPERGLCWVAETGGDVCGYLLAVFVFSLEHGGLMAEIDEFFIAEGGRSAGAGSELLAQAEREMAQLGLVRVQLQLGVSNRRARAFYERHGFLPRAGYELLDKEVRCCSPD